MRFFIYVGIVSVTLVHWSNVPVFAALCTPRRGEGWDMMLLSSTRCKPVSIHTVVTGATGTATDIYLLILPLPIILALNMAWRKKIGLILVFMAGILWVLVMLASRPDSWPIRSAIIASSCALYFRVILLKGKDISWDSAKVVICVWVPINSKSHWKKMVKASTNFTQVRRNLHGHYGLLRA